jgi:anti-sigma regulatory factor (Ser/Thr protein kinase)
MDHQLELPRGREAASRARGFVREHFCDRLGPARCHDVQLVVTELVANAVLHGSGRIVLKARLLGGSLRVEVVDEGTGNAPTIREQGGDDEGGWGLRIVDTLASRWGAYEGTTHVWADIATS